MSTLLAEHQFHRWCRQMPCRRIFQPPRTSIYPSNSKTASCKQSAPDPSSSNSITLVRDLESVLYSDSSQRFEATRFQSGVTTTASKISLVIVAAERLFGLGLAGLLSEDERLDVIGVSDGGQDVLGLCTAESVDVVLIDLELSRADSLDLVRLLASECPATKTLVLTSDPDWRVRSAMIAGAAGVLLKDTSPEATRAAVVSIHLGDQVLCNEAARWVLGEHPSVNLTKRESDVLRVVAQGAGNAEIARQLQLGEKTVRNYISRLYRKLNVQNRAQLATYLAHSDVAVQDEQGWFAGRTGSSIRSKGDGV